MNTKKNTNRPANIVDVARLAGVSTATVGRVLHQRGYVSASARQRVEQAIEQSGFRLNLVAQSLRRQRSKTLGHLVNSLIPNPFFAGIESGVEEAASEHGYSVFLWNYMADPEREAAGVEAFIRRQMDAIIFSTPYRVHNVQKALDAGLEVVQVERPTHLPTHCVLVDNYAGSVAAMQHLFELGHRRIGYVGQLPVLHEANPRHDLVDHQRFQGYHDWMVQNGISPLPEWRCTDVNSYAVEDGARAAECLLKLAEPVTAILLGCDILAAGAAQTCYQMGLHIPGDVALVGFDNTYAPFLTPPLTTVEVPTVEVGKAAACLAIRALEIQPDAEDSDEIYTQTISSRLVIRQSTGPPGRVAQN
jgi:LacI family transcriptional regulator